MAVRLNSKALLSQFLRLVRIDSPSLHERSLAILLKKELKALRARVFEDSAGSHVHGNCGNVIGIIKGTSRAFPTVMLSAHMDTVAIGVGVKPRVVKGVVTSDGTTALGADDKSGLIVILESLRQLRSQRVPHGDIIVAFTVGEEIGLRGAHFISKAVKRADFGYALDGGEPRRVHVKAPSQVMLKASVIGRAAHAGVHPEKGINAIQVAGRALSKMKLGRVDFETTANIGVIHGGVATNIVPERVDMVGEARSHNERKLRIQVSHMGKQFSQTCRRHRARLTFTVQRAFRSFSISHEAPVVEWTQKASERLKLKVAYDSTGGGSDANVFNGMGIPTVILGTGMNNVHTVREDIAVEDMLASIRLLTGIFSEIAGHGRKNHRAASAR